MSALELKPATRWRSEKGSHRGWVVIVVKVPAGPSVDVRVLKGQARGRSATFKLPKPLFGSAFQPA